MLLGKVEKPSWKRGHWSWGLCRMGRSSLALPLKHAEEEVTVLVQQGTEEAWPRGVEVEMRSGQVLGIFSLNWVYFYFGSLSTFCHCLQPRGLGPPSF